MIRLLNVAMISGVAGVFWYAIPAAYPMGTVQQMITALAILAAAVLVRLNRGMPTLDWKGITPEQRESLTGSVVAVTADYVRIIGLYGAFLLVLLALAAIGKDEISTAWPESWQRITSALIGCGLASSAVQMAYVVWRDFDIVRLQKRLIDAAADKELREQEVKAAAAKLSNMQSTNVRKVAIGEPKPWGE